MARSFPLLKYFVCDFEKALQYIEKVGTDCQLTHIRLVKQPLSPERLKAALKSCKNLNALEWEPASVEQLTVLFETFVADGQSTAKLERFALKIDVQELNLNHVQLNQLQLALGCLPSNMNAILLCDYSMVIKFSSTCRFSEDLPARKCFPIHWILRGPSFKSFNSESSNQRESPRIAQIESFGLERKLEHIIDCERKSIVASLFEGSIEAQWAEVQELAHNNARYEVSMFNDLAAIILDECPVLKSFTYIGKSGSTDAFDQTLVDAMKAKSIIVSRTVI